MQSQSSALDLRLVAAILRQAQPGEKEEVLKKAQLATSDPEHHLYPLFLNSDRTSPPTEVLQGEAEPEVGQAADPDGEGDAPSSEFSS
jgi:hypothetical protein